MTLAKAFFIKMKPMLLPLLLIFLAARLITIFSIAINVNILSTTPVSYFRWVQPEITIDAETRIYTVSMKTMAIADTTLHCALNGQPVYSIPMSTEESTIFIDFYDLGINTTPSDEIKLYVDYAQQLTDADTRVAGYRLYSLMINGCDLFVYPQSDSYTVTGLHDLEEIQSQSPFNSMDMLKSVMNKLNIWDAAWYGDIIQHGYKWNGDKTTEQNAAFLFMTPLLGYIVHKVTSMPVIYSQYTVAALCSFLTLLLFCKFLFDRTGDKNKAILGVMLFAFSPFNYALTNGLSESVFCLFVMLAILSLSNRQYLLFALFGGAVNATRQNGLIMPLIFLFVFFVVDRPGLTIKNILFSVMIAALSLWGYAVDILYKFTLFGSFTVTLDANNAWGINTIEPSFLKLIQFLVFPMRSRDLAYDLLSLEPPTLSMCLWYAVGIIIVVYMLKLCTLQSRQRPAVSIRTFISAHRDDVIILLYLLGNIAIILLSCGIRDFNRHMLGRYTLGAFPIISLLLNKTDEPKYWLAGIWLCISAYLSGVMAYAFITRIPGLTG